MKTIYLLPSSYVDISYFYPRPIGRMSPDHFDVLLREGIEKLGFKVEFTRDAKDLKNFAGLFAWERPKDITNLLAYPREQCILFSPEPPVVDPGAYDPEMKKYFGAILTLMDDYIDNETYFKIAVPLSDYRCKKWKQKFPTFEERSFAVLVNSNKMFPHPNQLYSERIKVIQFFAATGELDLYGPGWQGAPGWKNRGLSLEEKIEIIGNYKFCICYENMGNQRGYVTEKLMDCFIGSCVPVYLGATNVTDYIPADTFIDARNFTTYNELYQFLKSIDRKTHEAYLEAANRFLNSEKMDFFKDAHNLSVIFNLITRSQRKSL